MSEAPDAVDERIINIVRRHRDPEVGVSASDLGDRLPIAETTVRDRIEEMVKAGYAPIANFGDGYFWITHESQYQREREKHLDTKQSKQRRVDGLETAFNRAGPPTGRARTDGGQAAADVPEHVADAVEMLVDREGIEAAEDELKARAMAPDDNDRAKAGLAYLRREYRAEVGSQ